MEEGDKSSLLSRIALLFSVGVLIFLLILIFVTILSTGTITIDQTLKISAPTSLCLAIFALGIAFESDKRMIDNANVNFLHAAINFVEARSRYIRWNKTY